MAEEPLNKTITRNAEIPSSLNFQFLLKEGISHLEKSTGFRWTDYNTHDPGITILEALCYALTEVALHLDVDIFDLIASSLPDASGAKTPFLSQAEALPSHPYTETDFRKLLLDVLLSGYPTLGGTVDYFQPVKGLWLVPTQSPEPVFYFDVGNEQLSYESGIGVSLKGLYDIQFEYNHHPDYGNINTDIIRRSFAINETVIVGAETIQLRQTYNVDIAFPYWDEAEEAWQNQLLVLNNIALEPGEGGTPGEIRPLQEGEYTDFFTVIIVNPTDPETNPLTQNLRLGLSFKVTTPLINDSRDINNEEAGFILSALENLVIDITDAGVVFEFKEKVRIATDLANILQDTLYEHRNLGEDFVSFSALRIQEIGIRADLDLAVGADVEEVLGEVFLAIDTFFAPVVPRYDLETYRKEQLAKNPSTTLADLLAGPLPQNGFIDEEDLASLDAPDVIYTSDVVRIILALNQRTDWPTHNRILGVRNLSLSNYINNQEINLREYNCLTLTDTDIYRPRLSITKSRVSCYRQNRAVSYNLDVILSRVDAFKDAVSIGQPVPIVLPVVSTGERLPLGRYISIQEDFPMVYQLGKGQISQTTSPATKGKVKQLKGYLMLFEQILADLFAQVKNINSLLSTGAHERFSYYMQPLFDLPGARSILAPTITSEAGWQAFIADPGNSYLSAFEESDTSVIYGGTLEQIRRFEKFIDRRNRLLSHMIGRFNEDLSEYARQRVNYAVNAATTIAERTTRELEAKQEILYDRSLFLQDYGAVSEARSSGYDYRNTAETWDTLQVSGMVKRISRALGIRSCRRRDLFNTASVSEPDFQVVSELQNVNVFIIEFLAGGAVPLLRSIPYPNQPTAEAMVESFAQVGQRKAAYRYETIYDPALGIRYVAHLHDENDQLLASSAPLESEQERAALIDNCILWLNEKYSGEGLFVMEHILLRPKVRGGADAVSDFFLPVHLDNEEAPTADPYSFRVSVFLPAGLITPGGSGSPVPDLPFRFGTEEFRQLAERVIRQETPAHIKPHIFWLERPDMEAFQQVYRDWLERVADPNLGGITLLQAQQNLVNFLTPILDLST